MTQLTLDGMEQRRIIRAAPEREEPAVWIRALRIVKELSDAPDDVIREVRLRRGLNIVWAPPQASQSGRPTEEASIAGHTAGKTSFVRLLRYVLGDRHFGSEAVRRRIREHLPSAYVLAEVVVERETWGVARPLGVGAHPFSVRGATLDEIVAAEQRGDFGDYLEAIATSILPGLPATRFPDGNVAIGWEHLLPWLTRDQECRFVDFSSWRDSASDSESPALAAEQRHFLLRAVLDLVTNAEREEQERNAHLVEAKERLVARRPLLDHQAETDATRLCRLLDIDVPPAYGLFADAWRRVVDQLREDLPQHRDRLAAAVAAREKAMRNRDRARDIVVGAQRDVEDAELRLKLEQGALDQLDSIAAGEAFNTLFAALPVGRDYCNVRMADARAYGCPLASARVVALDEQRGARQPAEERAAQVTIVTGLRLDVQEKKSELAAADKSQRAAHGEYLRAQTAHDEARDVLLTKEQQLRETERLVALTLASGHEASKAADELRRLSDEIKASYTMQEALREERRQALAEFSGVFEHVVQALLGPGVHASVVAAGRSLALHVERDGERESAALSTIKLLAFDLAALTASIEGRGVFPRLLVHDGPREADLAAQIYERLFLYARDLEQISDGEPAFQYVLTTTSEPPQELQGEPWVRLLLSGAVGDARLYRMDL